MGLVRPARGLVRLLYTSNPFYILSADLVFVGLRMSFGPGGPAAESWALAVSLAGYTLLLATTACVLIRLGRLWDDLRSLLLLIVMMFLAIAMSCDDTMAADPRRGSLGYLGRAGLRGGGHRGGAAHDPAPAARLVSRGLLRDPRPWCSSIRSRWSRCWATRRIPSLQWALFGFSPLAGAGRDAAGARRRGAGGRTWRRTAAPGDGRCIPGRCSS